MQQQCTHIVAVREKLTKMPMSQDEGANVTLSTQLKPSTSEKQLQKEGDYYFNSMCCNNCSLSKPGTGLHSLKKKNQTPHVLEKGEAQDESNRDEKNKATDTTLQSYLKDLTKDKMK